MKKLAVLVSFIDGLNETIGRMVSWLTLAMVLITFSVVVLRYVFSVGWVWMQESYVWLHGVVFMVGAGYTLLHNGHVRVDIFYRSGSERYRAVIDLIGSIFLLSPMIVIVLLGSWDYVIKSWVGLEESREAGGLPGLFLLKTVLWVFCVLVALQAVSLMGRSWLVLNGGARLISAERTRE
jgi:TRAP-type mannitol/chloroaromatic compound transport system permease small subunit